MLIHARLTPCGRLGKVAVAAGCGVIAFGLAELPWYRNRTSPPSSSLPSALLPVCVAVVIGWIVAHLFLQVTVVRASELLRV